MGKICRAIIETNYDTLDFIRNHPLIEVIAIESPQIDPDKVTLLEKPVKPTAELSEEPIPDTQPHEPKTRKMDRQNDNLFSRYELVAAMNGLNSTRKG